MRLLLLNVHFSPTTYGGATVVAEEVAFALRANHGVEVFVISAVSRQDLAPYAVSRIEVRGLAHFLINLPHGRSRQELDFNPRVAERIAQIAQFVEPDVVHAHAMQELGAGALTALKAAGIPVILSIHDFWWICERQFMMRPNGTYCGQDPIRVDRCVGCVDDISRTRARTLMLGEIASRCDRITYPTDFALDLCLRSGLGRAEQSVVWENGIRPPRSDFFDKQSAHRQSATPFTFGYLGGPSDMKGWPLMRQALRRIDRDDFALHLVNGSPWGNWWDGHDLSDLRGEVKIVPRFAQDGIDDFFAGIDCLLFLSQWKETFGLTIREAISRGIRVIQTDSGGTVDHPLADPRHLIPIGNHVDKLIEEMRHALQSRDAPPAPVTVRSYDQQADELMVLARGLLDQPG